MNRSCSILVAAAVVVLGAAIASAAVRGGHIGGARGGGRAGGGVHRPATSAPHFGGSRPTPAARPRPSPQRPPVHAQQPSPRPAGGIKPTRPSVSRPNPTTRPGGSRLPERPTTHLPNLGGAVRPGGGLPGYGPGSSRPGSSRPGLAARPGAGRPRPGQVDDFLGIHRPTRPGGVSRPGGTRPGVPGIGKGERPGIGKGERPGLPGIGKGNRPGIGKGERPGLPGIGKGDRPLRPDRPIAGNRPHRPINIGNEINVGIHNRPSWTNISSSNVRAINHRWSGAIRQGGSFRNWTANHPDRFARYGYWGSSVRHGWWQNHWHSGWFNGAWWGNHLHPWGGWHYWHAFGYRPYSYWWTVPTWAALSTWFTWSTPTLVSQPVYYDYGAGGNVYYQDNSVYVGDQRIASAREFAESAADLATVAPPSSEEEAEKAEWMALGTFAVASSEKETDPTRIVQLAVNKQGIVSGTLYNTQTDKAQTIQGSVDKETQRVAMRIGASEDVVIETGLYNLTKDEAPVMVHFGPEKVEYYLLVRLDNPDGEDEDATDLE